MAEVNLIQRGDLQRRLVEGLELVGERSPAPVLATEVVPVVVLENLIEQNVARGPVGKWAAHSETVAAVAAEFTTFGLSNPAGSGVVIVVDTVVASTGTSHEVAIGLAAVPPTAGLAEASSLFIDSRNAGLPVGDFRIGTDLANQVGTFMSKHRVPAHEYLFPTFAGGKPVVNPGEELIVQSQTVNIGLTVGIVWKEYEQ